MKEPSEVYQALAEAYDAAEDAYFEYLDLNDELRFKADEDMRAIERTAQIVLSEEEFSSFSAGR